MADDREKITWQAPAYHTKEKGADWYWSVGIIATAFVAIAIMLDNYIFAAFIALATFTLLLFAAKKPKEVPVVITAAGITFDRYFYSYDSIHAFTVNPNLGQLILKLKKLFMPLIVISLMDTDPGLIHETLSQYLEEEQLHESPFQKLLELLGF